MAQSPPYLHPFACFACRRSFKRPGERDEAVCPVCGTRAVRLNRKFKAPRREDVEQWEKVEALVKLGFRFDTLYDANGLRIHYPSSKKGIPAFVEKVAQVADDRTRHATRTKAALGLKRRQQRSRTGRKGQV